MQNEPQLSAETEAKFEKMWTEGTGLHDRAKHFLATALEEQRLRYIKKEEKLPVSKLSIYQIIDVRDVFTILNGKDV